jgi:asparagine synthase (glutamine-hydrolysing)
VSAIIGIYYPDGRAVDREDIERMVKVLEHRGKDGSDIWNKDSVGLGHRLLWTTPESLLETLPLSDRSGNYILTADARIDNRDELIIALGLTDCPAEKITDSQLILSAYEKWGESCPDRLLGDFAFVIWDRREQKLFAARDHFGVKPFYYYYLPRKTFIFASEIKGILSQEEVPGCLNEIKIASYLTVKLNQDDSTFYKDILRLPAGHSITVSSSGFNLRCYWSLDPTREIEMGSNQDYAEAFREIFTEAVRCRLRSAFPIGSQLSGGLDSSFIVGVARNILLAEKREPLHTFSARFQNSPECDERYFQDRIIEQGNLQPHFLEAGNLSPFTDLDRMLWHHDEVFLPANIYFTWGTYKIAQELGIRVVLNGFDGDNTVSHGYDYLRELARHGRWLTLSKETWEYGKTWQIPRQKVFKTQWNWLWRYGIRPKIASAIKQISPINLTRTSNSQFTLDNGLGDSPINLEFAKRLNVIEKLQTQQYAPPNTERERHYQGLTDGILQHCLECYSSAEGAFGIESRSPFCDKRLLEFCLALPPNQKLHYGWDRIVMRRAMEGILPSEIQWRVGKANFAPSLEQGLFNYERERFEYVIKKKPNLIRDFVDLSFITNAYDRFSSNQVTENDVNNLHRTVFLGMWLEKTRF